MRFVQVVHNILVNIWSLMSKGLAYLKWGHSHWYITWHFQDLILHIGQTIYFMKGTTINSLPISVWLYWVLITFSTSLDEQCNKGEKWKWGVKHAGCQNLLIVYFSNNFQFTWLKYHLYFGTFVFLVETQLAVCNVYNTIKSWTNRRDNWSSTGSDRGRNCWLWASIMVCSRGLLFHIKVSTMPLNVFID